MPPQGPKVVVVKVEWLHSKNDPDGELQLLQRERAWVKLFPTAEALVQYCASRLGEIVGETLRQSVQAESGGSLTLSLEDAGRLGIPVRVRPA
jgi:hypothetical protein